MDVLRWGRPPLALLPVALAKVLSNEPLPGWLSEHLDGQDTSLMALDASAWEHLPHDEEFCERAAHYVLDLVTGHARELEDVRIGRPLLHSHEPLGLGRWPTRARNAVLRSGIAADPSRLASLTLGQVHDIPYVGIRTALDIAALLELYPIDGDSDENAPEHAGGMAIAVMDVAPPTLDEAARQDLMMAMEEEWAERFRADDPRFRDVAPPHAGSLSALFDEVLNSPVGARAHAVANALPAIRGRAQEIASEPIDVAVVRLLRSLGVSDRNATIVVARLGLREGGPRSLQEVGDEFSMTRERVRQIVDKVLDPIGATYLPQVERAIQLLTARAPITVEDASRLLVEEGLATFPIVPGALRAAADVLGYEVTFQIDPGHTGVAYVLAKGLPGTGEVVSVARREAGRVGVSNIEEVHAALEADGNNISTDAVARVLRSSPRVEFLDEEWFWMPDIPADRNRLRNVTQRMISVTPRLDIPTIRRGVKRRYRFMKIDLVPPTDILAAFYIAHPEFVVHPDDTVGARTSLDYRKVLGDADRAFVEVLRESPTGLMDRQELEVAVTARGIAPATFSVFTTYSPILDHPAMNVWCLRGHNVDPAHLEALRAAIATRPRQRRVLNHGRDENGALRLTVTIGTLNSPVIGIPTSIREDVAGRRFAARTREGAAAGVIAVDYEGRASWGYGPFLHRRGAEVGDVLTIRFDLAAEQVILTLGEEVTRDESD